jgi:putative Mg2+ transporter-C (MgtC) family protein
LSRFHLVHVTSESFGASDETARIASNIVTGIGFLGAEAIMREGLTVSGLTTASSIRVTAALGMAVGAGKYFLAFCATLVVIAVLTLFEFIQALIERYQKAIGLHITFSGDAPSMSELEKEMENNKLKFEKIRTVKRDGDSVFYYEVFGPKKILNAFLKTLNKNKAIKSFQY